MVRTELITPELSEALANLLGTDIPTDELPTLWHWIHLLEKRPHADLGPDGHPTFGIPAPSGPGRKRMFAGNRVRKEGHGALVVHGPLQALMMGGLIRRYGDGLIGKQCAYRLVSPMIAHKP